MTIDYVRHYRWTDDKDEIQYDLTNSNSSARDICKFLVKDIDSKSEKSSRQNLYFIIFIPFVFILSIIIYLIILYKKNRDLKKEDVNIYDNVDYFNLDNLDNNEYLEIEHFDLTNEQIT